MGTMGQVRHNGRSAVVSVVALALAALAFGGVTGSGARADDDGAPPAAGGGVLPSDRPDKVAKPLAEGGGVLPGVQPTAPTSGSAAGTGSASPYDSPALVADAIPSVDPNFVDNYTQLWKDVERGKVRVKALSTELDAARQVLAASSSDLGMALRERNRSEVSLAQAADQLDVAVRDMYITGTTDVDVVLGILGSKPEDVLRNIDSFQYLRSATGNETVDFVAAKQFAVITQSAAASAQIRALEDDTRVEAATLALAAVRAKLKKDQKELQKLIAVAAPQTVVGSDGCPKSVTEGTVPPGIDVKKLCEKAVKGASTPQAAFAIKWALVRLGAPYACEGIGRLEPWRYDCSSYVSRAYAEGAGLKTAGDSWAPSTRNMVPWDGVALDPHYAVIPSELIRPGDLVLYDTCPAGQTCPYRHVVMYLGPMTKGGVPMMAHTNSCGSVAHVAPFIGTDVANFLGVRRVVTSSGEKVIGRVDAPKKPDKPGKPGKGQKKARD